MNKTAEKNFSKWYDDPYRDIKTLVKFQDISIKVSSNNFWSLFKKLQKEAFIAGMNCANDDKKIFKKEFEKEFGVVPENIIIPE